VHVPAVVGVLKPTVLIPASMITGLTTEQLDALIIHELAHIRRHDYLLNLIQTIIETLLFYHPVVWWVSHSIRVEREHCCDDLAVSNCCDPVVYAKALTSLEESRHASIGWVMAADRGNLLRRVERLLLPSLTRSDNASRILAGVAIMALVTGVGLASVARNSLLESSITEQHLPELEQGENILYGADSDDALQLKWTEQPDRMSGHSGDSSSLLSQNITDWVRTVRLQQGENEDMLNVTLVFSEYAQFEYMEARNRSDKLGLKNGAFELMLNNMRLHINPYADDWPNMIETELPAKDAATLLQVLGQRNAGSISPEIALGKAREALQFAGGMF
jgi:hypothetical protein